MHEVMINDSRGSNANSTYPDACVMICVADNPHRSASPSVSFEHSRVAYVIVMSRGTCVELQTLRLCNVGDGLTFKSGYISYAGFVLGPGSGDTAARDDAASLGRSELAETPAIQFATSPHCITFSCRCKPLHVETL